MKCKYFLLLALALLLTGCAAQKDVTSTEPVVTTQTPAATVETTEEAEMAATQPTLELEEGQMEYEKFRDMKAAEQQAFLESFESLDAFFEWYNRVKEEYAAAHPAIEIGDGVVDMGDLMD